MYRVIPSYSTCQSARIPFSLMFFFSNVSIEFEPIIILYYYNSIKVIIILLLYNITLIDKSWRTLSEIGRSLRAFHEKLIHENLMGTYSVMGLNRGLSQSVLWKTHPNKFYGHYEHGDLLKIDESNLDRRSKNFWTRDLIGWFNWCKRTSPYKNI